MSTNRIRITIDHEKCIGSGNCAFNADGVFDQDDDGLAYVVDADARSIDVIEFAASSCPVNAIRVERE